MQYSKSRGVHIGVVHTPCPFEQLSAQANSPGMFWDLRGYPAHFPTFYITTFNAHCCGKWSFQRSNVLICNLPMFILMLGAHVCS